MAAEIREDVQFVFDTNILVDALLARGPFYHYAVDLLEQVRDGHHEGWYAPHSLTTAYYLISKTLATETRNQRQARQITHQLLNKVLAFLKPLPQVGDEIKALPEEDGDDLEDLLIVELARTHLPNPLIVTRDKTFLQRGGIQAAHPKEILERGPAAWGEERQSIPFIDLAAQQRSIRPALDHRIAGVLRHGQYIMGPEVRELEARLADYVGVPHCITASSGTDTLLIAMMALGIGPGDEVITTPFTFIATGEMIALLGATPVFVDIDPHTYNIDPDQIEPAITPNTRAIMPVSLYGQCADFDAINAIAEKHGLPVIEDGAQSFGATYKGRRSCGLSTIGSTSFFPSKPLGGYGDGGALFTHDDHLAKAMREIRVHGQDRRYHHPRIGLNGRMDTLQAAIVLAKLDRFPLEVEARARLGERYNRLFQERLGDRVVVPHIAPHNTSVFAQYTLQVEQRDAVQEALKAQDVPTAVHYPVPLHHQPAFTTGQARCPAQGLPVSERISQRVISLPMHPMLGEGEQMRIVQAVIEAHG
ncbi:aminotransferase class I/II-fold pyridoxal phosphate-dependent enzyme [Ectothiorhodospira variabilis]|uniref:aminotransferase class I/II-fold pyridoxal phosphate-dependent enzyme n=1 Tax=Ectothiorhodospira variabilis TaxID=505694 RepID=UPI0023788850|nr:aminotransferase class I/II-fold pyridoxal phosphate-dependent enzyme [Ectothiorhodospira variabilis]